MVLQCSGVGCQVSERLVLALVLDTVSNIVSPIYFFDYENEDDDEDDLSHPKYIARNAITAINSTQK
jgi:hypothetical protein